MACAGAWLQSFGLNVTFSFLGIPVRVHGFFWLSAVFLGMPWYRDEPIGLTWWIPIVFVAILLHEMGHALAARRYGLNPEVHLLAFGGVTRMAAGRLTHARSIWVSFAGPLVGLVIGGAAYFALTSVAMPRVATMIARDIFLTNFWWAIFNLVPIVGLDGGNIMAAALDRFFGARGQRFARLFSIVVAAALIALALAVQNLFMVFVIGMLAWQNYREWQASSQFADRLQSQARMRPRAPAPQSESLEAPLREGWSALEAGDAPRVHRIAEALVSRARSDDDRFDVAHLLAWGRALTNDPEGAAQALRMLPRGRLPDALLEGVIQLELGRPAQAVKPLAEAIVGRADDFVAKRLARAAAGSARYDDVLAILDDAGKSEAVGVRALQIVVNEAFYAGHHEPAAKLGERLFARFGQASDAFNVACALGQLGRGADALGWLEKAIDAGLSDPSVIDRDGDLAPLRALPEFQALRVKAGLATT
ncbi:site-2 protease family protein [Sandaracinus amylolyticus]|uniref:Putative TRANSMEMBRANE ALANINE AND LEUCINE RICH PROTEIN n=1 Tax=Sandaracinus amylolyticus TaxID=927083 RepID=A0A0F6W2C7_9BACT|nr:site-2 protease family protein [Sandaracinus amylolyticus]AKF05477.1 Putative TRANSMEMBRANE ALANINE AND LEUCINE RICH PROTEIN [Sandaracinus amylolyticus]